MRPFGQVASLSPPLAPPINRPLFAPGKSSVVPRTSQGGKGRPNRGVGGAWVGARQFLGALLFGGAGVETGHTTPGNESGVRTPVVRKSSPWVRIQSRFGGVPPDKEKGVLDFTNQAITSHYKGVIVTPNRKSIAAGSPPFYGKWVWAGRRRGVVTQTALQSPKANRTTPSGRSLVGWDGGRMEGVAVHPRSKSTHRAGGVSVFLLKLRSRLASGGSSRRTLPLASPSGRGRDYFRRPARTAPTNHFCALRHLSQFSDASPQSWKQQPPPGLLRLRAYISFYCGLLNTALCFRNCPHWD